MPLSFSRKSGHTSPVYFSFNNYVRIAVGAALATAVSLHPRDSEYLIPRLGGWSFALLLQKCPASSIFQAFSGVRAQMDSRLFPTL